MDSFVVKSVKRRRPRSVYPLPDSKTLALTISLCAASALTLSGCATTLERYQTITQSLGDRIDAVVSPTISAIGNSRIVAGSASALDRLNRKLSWIERVTGDGGSARDSGQHSAAGTQAKAATTVNRHIAIAPSRCLQAQSDNAETTRLKTTARLRLRNAPSVDAVTIRIIEQGADLTAKRVTCGNWTEVVRDEKPIGFVFSAFLTTPSD